MNRLVSARMALTSTFLATLVACDSTPSEPPGETTTPTADTIVVDDGADATVTTDPTGEPDTATTPDDTSTATAPDDATTADDTATADDTVDEIPVPGEAITWNAPPSGYSKTQPAWAEDGLCTAGQWWQFSGTQESKNMHPGRTCIDCHSRNHGPSFRFAGTVYADVNDTDDCRGVPGVKVEILKDDGTVHATTTTSAAGNFYFTRTTTAAVTSFRARLTYNGRTREMTDLVVGTKGDCNACHTTDGASEAPGRIVVP